MNPLELLEQARATVTTEKAFEKHEVWDYKNDGDHIAGVVDSVFEYETRSQYREGMDVGVVVNADSCIMSGKAGSPSRYLVYASDYKILREELAGIQVGDAVAIVHKGLQQRGERKYRKFIVKVSKKA